LESAVASLARIPTGFWLVSYQSGHLPGNAAQTTSST
jgi:hypothetical protein